MGARGVAIDVHGEVVRIPAREVRGADPTGAGDAFAAAYAAARSDGFRAVTAARRASAAVAWLLEARRR